METNEVRKAVLTLCLDKPETMCCQEQEPGGIPRHTYSISTAHTLPRTEKHQDKTGQWLPVQWLPFKASYTTQDSGLGLVGNVSVTRNRGTDQG